MIPVGLGKRLVRGKGDEVLLQKGGEEMAKVYDEDGDDRSTTTAFPFLRALPSLKSSPALRESTIVHQFEILHGSRRMIPDPFASEFSDRLTYVICSNESAVGFLSFYLSLSLLLSLSLFLSSPYSLIFATAK